MEPAFLLSSLWLGILTSISPCPLVSNIAAVSYIGQKVGSPYYVLLSGLVYTLGRTTLYTALGILLSLSLSSIPGVSHFLQTKMPYVIGPVLILVGLLILDIIRLKLPTFSISQNSQKKMESRGLAGVFMLGFLFALALCPVSAALFLGNLIKTKGDIPSLILYGIGTGLPVLGLAFVLAFSMNSIATIHSNILAFEQWARKITGLIFIGGGLYYIAMVLQLV